MAKKVVYDHRFESTQVNHEILLQMSKSSKKCKLSEILLCKDTLKGSSFPIPLFSLDYSKRIFDFDPIESIIESKIEFDTKKGVLMRLLKNQHDKVPDGYITSDFKEFLTMKLEDPDLKSKRLHYLFNWRHHGGNLTDYKSKTIYRLVRPKFVASKVAMKLVHPSKFTSNVQNYCEDYLRNDYVYEVKGYRENYVFRKLKSIQIVNINDPKNVVTEFKTQREISSCVPYEDDVYLIDISGKLKRFNIISQMLIDLKKMKTAGLPFVMHSYERDEVSMSDAKKFTIFDIRNNDEIALLFDDNNMALQCEEFFNHKKSLRNSNQIFVASSHGLYLCDVRNPKKAVAQTIHQLLRPPMMIKSLKINENDEVVCISSTMNDDIKLLNFSHANQRFDLLPLKPNSMEKSMNELNMNGKFLLADSLKSRVKMSVSGIQLSHSTEDNKFDLFIQSSIGDIFKNSIFLSNEFEMKPKDFESRFSSWNEAVNKEQPTWKDSRLNFNNVVDLKGLRRFFLYSKNKNSEEVEEGHEINYSNVSQMHEMKVPRWKISMKEAHEFKDLLAPHILAPWEMQDDEDEFDISTLPLQTQTEMKRNEKVENWLSAHTNSISTKSMENIEIEEENVEVEVEEESAASSAPKLLTTPKIVKRVAGF